MTTRLNPVRRAVLAVTALAATALAACGGNAAHAGGGGGGAAGVLTIGMTAGDIPNLDTVLSGGQGYEGYRFVGNQLYDSLTRYNLKQDSAIPQVMPALATSFTSNANATQWTFQLRTGVTFTDGTPFDADAVIYNLDRYLNKSSPAYYAPAAADAALSLGAVKSYRKVGESQVVFTMAVPDSHLPADLSFIYLASPTALKKEGNEGFALHPVGTGPFMLKSLTRGQQAVFVPNPDYWGGSAKVTELVLKPIPDAAARLAALQSGQVNWIEAPNPDDLDQLKSSGYQVFTNSYDHVWPWILDTTKKPLNDARVRQAMNYAIDRNTMATTLLHGTADPAYQLIPKASLSYRSSNDIFSYNQAKAKQLLAEAGYPNGFTMSLSYPTSGSGNMEPGPMNQELQSDLAKVGIKVELKPIEWATMLTSYTTGKIPDGADAINISLTFLQESFWSLSFGSTSPLNLAHYKNPTVDELLAQAQSQPDPAKRSDIYAQIGALIDQDAPWLVIVNDRNPRVLASNVHGFVEPKSWFVDLTTVTVS